MTTLACMTLYALLVAFGRHFNHYVSSQWDAESSASLALLCMVNSGFVLDHPFRPGGLRGL